MDNNGSPSRATARSANNKVAKRNVKEQRRSVNLSQHKAGSATPDANAAMSPTLAEVARMRKAIAAKHPDLADKFAAMVGALVTHAPTDEAADADNVVSGGDGGQSHGGDAESDSDVPAAGGDAERGWTDTDKGYRVVKMEDDDDEPIDF